MHSIITIPKYISFAVSVPARFDIYQDLSLLGFWIFVVAGVSLLVAGVYRIMKPFRLFQKRTEGNDGSASGHKEEDLTSSFLPVMHQFVRSTPLPVAVFNSDLQFITVSKQWLTMFGLTEMLIIGKSFYQVFPGSKSVWGEMHRRCLEGNREKSDHDFFVKPDGKSEWVGFDMHPWFLDSDRVGGLIIYAEVTTEKQQSEATLKRARELAEEASRSKSDFISNMSHELCTPLTCILGYAQMLESDSGLASGQLNQVKEIRKSGEHLLSRIRDILDFAKLGTHKVTFTADSIDLAGLLKDIIRLKIRKYGSEKINVDVEIDPDMPASLISDRQKLRTILENLVDNAFKFTKEGDITIVASLQRSEKSGADRVLGVTVGDTGTGISPSKLDQIFTPFTQLSQHFVEGTGMGLSLSRGFAQFLGGTLDVVSEYGMGSVFMLEIPVQVPSRTLQTVQNTVPLAIDEPADPEYSPREISEFIKSLGEPSTNIIQEALRLKDVPLILNLEKILDLPERRTNGVFGCLKRSAETGDFYFMDSVNSELEKDIR